MNEWPFMLILIIMTLNSMTGLSTMEVIEDFKREFFCKVLLKKCLIITGWKRYSRNNIVTVILRVLIQKKKYLEKESGQWGFFLSSFLRWVILNMFLCWWKWHRIEGKMMMQNNISCVLKSKVEIACFWLSSFWSFNAFSSITLLFSLHFSFCVM